MKSMRTLRGHVADGREAAIHDLPLHALAGEVGLALQPEQGVLALLLCTNKSCRRTFPVSASRNRWDHHQHVLPFSAARRLAGQHVVQHQQIACTKSAGALTSPCAHHTPTRAPPMPLSMTAGVPSSMPTVTQRLCHVCS